MKKFFLALVAILAVCGVVWAADNYRIGIAGGQTVTLRTTDTAGVHTPHVNVVSQASTTGGATSVSFVAAATNNATSLAGARTVYSVQLGGIGAAPAYLKFYDKATAPTCQSDTIVAQYIIPAASTAANGGGSNISIPVGMAFTTGLAYCVVTGIAANDNTAVAAATYVVTIQYK